MPMNEMRRRVTELGIKYQLVTDQTSMLVLEDGAFAANGVERLNAARTDIEHAAQNSGSGQGTSVPVTGGKSSATHDGQRYGGALDPLTVALSVLWLLGGRRRGGRSP